MPIAAPPVRPPSARPALLEGCPKEKKEATEGKGARSHSQASSKAPTPQSWQENHRGDSSLARGNLGRLNPPPDPNVPKRSPPRVLGAGWLGVTQDFAVVLPIPRRFDARPLAGTAQPPPRSPLPSRCQLPKPAPQPRIKQGHAGRAWIRFRSNTGGGIKALGRCWRRSQRDIGEGAAWGQFLRVCRPPPRAKRPRAGAGASVRPPLIGRRTGRQREEAVRCGRGDEGRKGWMELRS